MYRIFAVMFLFLCSQALAAPQQVTAVYHATRNGQPFADVTETFVQKNGRYKLESVTHGIGVYGLFGERRLTSEGLVTDKGLRPVRYESRQGDNAKKTLLAEFDWASGTLAMKARGKTSTTSLETGAQDLLSYAYQFMFRPPSGDEVTLPVTTGKKLHVYHYRIAERNVRLKTAAGSFTTVHLVNAESGGDAKEFWLGTESHHIPVRITLRDEHGFLIEQTLTSLHVE